MTGSKMHADELHTDAELVRRLLTDQFPQWAELPIERVASSGTDNALYRVGPELVVRMPRIHWAIGSVHKDYEWLPKLAPHLPISIPEPLAKGDPGHGYPWTWGVYRWLPGENPDAGPGAAPLARDVAQFVAALRRIDGSRGPGAYRGSGLTMQIDGARYGLTRLRGVIDTETAALVWDRALRAPAWSGPDTWLHGDLMPGNLLVQDGRLSAVIDWGSSGTGDPAADVMVAWTLFDREGRRIFREELGVEDAEWDRGRGWALSTGLNALPYYMETNPVLAENARYRIEQLLAEVV